MTVKAKCDTECDFTKRLCDIDGSHERRFKPLSTYQAIASARMRTGVKFERKK